MINFNIAQAVEQEPISYAEFSKAVDAIGLVVIDEDGLNKFLKDLNGLIQKGEASALTQEELDIIEKGRKDYSKLVKKTITTANGIKKTVYVKAGDNKPAEKKSGKEEGGDKKKTPIEQYKPKDEDVFEGNTVWVSKHKQLAKESGTDKLQEYIKSGTDPDLRKIAQAELKRRENEESGDDKKSDSKHKVGDNVVDKDGNEGKVTHVDDKEVVVEYNKPTKDGVDISNYSHEELKKKDPADSMAKNAAKKHAGTKGKLGDAAKEAKEGSTKQDLHSIAREFSGKPPSTGYRPSEEVTSMIEENLGDDYTMVKFDGSEEDYVKWGNKNPVKNALSTLEKMGMVDKVKKFGDPITLKDGSELAYDEVDDITAEVGDNGEAMAKNGFILMFSGNYDGAIMLAVKNNSSKKEKAYSPDLLKAFESFNIKP